jgi:hypothetical protein
LGLSPRAVLAAALLAAPPASAASCVPGARVTVRGTEAWVAQLLAGPCYVSVRPVWSPGMVYRDYAFYEGGLLLAFSSYGDGGSEMTSGREIRFFPRLGLPALDADPAKGALLVSMSDGARVAFDVDKAAPASVDRGEVRIASRVHPDERGGVEFPSYRGLILDSGYRRGEMPSGRRGAESVFRDASGRLCAVRNDEVFVYNEDGNPEFRFADAELSAWLKTRCPSLEPGF